MTVDSLEYYMPAVNVTMVKKIVVKRVMETLSNLELSGGKALILIIQMVKIQNKNSIMFILTLLTPILFTSIFLI